MWISLSAESGRHGDLRGLQMTPVGGSIVSSSEENTNIHIVTGRCITEEHFYSPSLNVHLVSDVLALNERNRLIPSTTFILT